MPSTQGPIVRPPKDQHDPVWQATVTTISPLVHDLVAFGHHLPWRVGSCAAARENRRLPHPTSRPITADVRTGSSENALPTSLNKATLSLCVTEAF